MLRFSLCELFSWGAQAPPPRSPTHFVQIGIVSPGSPCRIIRSQHVLTCELSAECPVEHCLRCAEGLFSGDFSDAAAVLVWAPMVSSKNEVNHARLAAQIEQRFLACGRRLVRMLGANRVYAMVSPQSTPPSSDELRELAHQVLELVSAGVLERNILHGAAELWTLVFKSGDTERGAVG